MKKNTVHFFQHSVSLNTNTKVLPFRSSLKENQVALHIIHNNWYSRSLPIWNGVVARLSKTMLWEDFLVNLTIVVECDWNPQQSSKKAWRKVVLYNCCFENYRHIVHILIALFKDYSGYVGDKYCIFVFNSLISMFHYINAVESK